MNDCFNHHYLEDRILNKERQIICTEKQYNEEKNKLSHFPKVIGGIVFVPLLLLASMIHYQLLLNFGFPSLYITPVSFLTLMVITGTVIKISQNKCDEKVSKLQQTIQRLEKEKAGYAKQLQKVKANTTRKTVNHEMSDIVVNPVITDVEPKKGKVRVKTFINK